MRLGVVVVVGVDIRRWVGIAAVGRGAWGAGSDFGGDALVEAGYCLRGGFFERGYYGRTGEDVCVDEGSPG